ncbi:MAG: ABC transporter permease [Lachnospiraceae bacterium]|nr:ABC transporter permease [Lachnospiraceae bacterium]
MCIKRKKDIAYIAGSIFITIVFILLFSNIDLIKGDLNEEIQYNSGVVQAYLYEDNLYRFAIVDIDQLIYQMELRVAAEREDFQVEVHYQGFDSEEYFQVHVKKIGYDDGVVTFILQDAGEAKNLYVDIYGEFEKEPSIIIDKISSTFKIMWETVVLGICILGLAFVIFVKRDFLFDIYNNKDILTMLLSNDINARYAGSFFGGIWSYAQPLISIFVFWFVFQLGFKSSPVQNMPFILWFLPAYIAWMYFQDVIAGSTTCLREYSYLVKKIKFKVSIIPIIKVLAAFKIHICFVVVTFLIYAIYGMKPTVKCLQLLYYSFAMVFLLTGISWLVAVLNVFIKDMAPIINIVLQLGYFAIPIFWNEEMLHPFVVKVLKFNPVYYIVEGYRNSICGGIWFWENVRYMCYYWGISIIVFCIGLWLFDGAKKHFSDLL